MPSVTFTAGSTLTAAQMNQIGQDSDWVTISSFSNSWAVGTRSVQYRKVGNRVQLIGVIQSGTAGNTAFTLPSGYRPLTNLAFPTGASSGATNIVQVGSDGTIKPVNGNTITPLDPISFYID